jgi:hypothetical protein
MAQSGVYQSLQVCRVRAAKLDATGAPLVGPNNAYVSAAVITVRMAFDFMAGVEITAENGCGGICAYYKGPDRLRKINLSFELCDLDSELIEVLTTTSLITSGGETIGHMLPRSGACHDEPNNGVSLEFWSNRWDACSVPSGAQVGLNYWHWAFPKVILRTGDMTLENGFLRVPVEGYATENPNWGDGPFHDFPGGVGALDSTGAVWADAAMPDPDTTYIAVAA